MVLTVDEAIAKAYHDPAGFGSLKSTLLDAQKYNKEVTLADVRAWKAQNVVEKKQLRGYNSYVVSEPYFEYQLDLMFFTDLREKPDTGLIAVDIFTKYTQVVPVDSKQVPDILDGVKRVFEKMGRLPKVVYSDNEGAFVSKEVTNFFKNNNIKHIVTLGHAPVAERQIRTIKDMIYKRLEHIKSNTWTEVLYPTLLTYNNKMVHSTTKMTPNEARKPENTNIIKLNLEMKARFNRRYPEVHVGNRVRIFKKKDKLDKERVSNWTDHAYVIERVGETFGQPFYKVAGRDRMLSRNEILLVR